MSVGVSMTWYSRMMCGWLHIRRMWISRRTLSIMSNDLMRLLLMIFTATFLLLMVCCATAVVQGDRRHRDKGAATRSGQPESATSVAGSCDRLRDRRNEQQTSGRRCSANLREHVHLPDTERRCEPHRFAFAKSSRGLYGCGGRELSSGRQRKSTLQAGDGLSGGGV